MLISFLQFGKMWRINLASINAGELCRMQCLCDLSWTTGTASVKTVQSHLMFPFQQEPQNSAEEDASSDNSQFTGSTINLQDLE